MQLQTITHFFNKRVYTVPDYQRGYSWAEKNVLDLLKDITHSIQLNNFHYMGTITIHPQDEKVKIGLNNYTNYNVVDGQQRFTTLILIISYVLTKLKGMPETSKDANEKIENYLKYRDSFIFRYSIDKVSDDYFRSVILELEEKSSDEENLYTRNLYEAKKTIRGFFEAKNLKFDLLTYLNAIEEKLQFNEYVVNDSSDIGVVFETMNNRGIDLSNLEIVKNRLLYLTSKLPENEESKGEIRTLTNEINNSWSHILKNLTLPSKVLNEDSFLSNHWIIYSGWTKSGQEKIEILEETFTIDQMVEAPLKMKDRIRSYIKSLAATSLHWRYINYPEEDKAFSDVEDTAIKSELKLYFTKLNRLSNSTVRPLLIAFFPLMKSKPDVLLELCKLAEIFSFRLFSMNRRRSDTGKNDIYRNCKWLHESCTEEKSIKYALFLFAWYIDEYGDIDRFELEVEELFRSPRKSGHYSWAGLTYLLFEYEEAQRKKESPKLDYSFANLRATSIEHILPQTPSNPYWKTVLKGCNGEQVKRLTHSLGNLLLISVNKNSELRNREFNFKKDSYFNGSFSEIQVAKSFSDWNEETILDREKKLLSFLDKHWQLNVNFLDRHPNPFNEELEIQDEYEDVES